MCRPDHRSRSSSVMDHSHRLDTSSFRPGNNSRSLRRRSCYNDRATSYGRATRANDGGMLRRDRCDLFCGASFCHWLFRRFRLLPLRSRLWITVCDMPLRIYRRERSIVIPGVRAFLQSA